MIFNRYQFAVNLTIAREPPAFAIPTESTISTIYVEGFCFCKSASTPLCLVFPSSCCSLLRSSSLLSPVRLAKAPPTVPPTLSFTPWPKSDSWPWASWFLPSRFCWMPSCFSPWAPMRLPMDSLAAPTVWFHDP